MEIWMKCPSCEGLFSAPLGHAEGGCVFCGVILKINTGVKVLRQEDENGVAVQPGWEEFRRPREGGKEDRPMFVVKKADRALAVY